MKKNIKNKRSETKFLWKVTICLALLCMVFLSMNTSYISFATESNQKEFCYLSDIPYVAEQSSVGWKEISLDKTPDNAPISVKVEGTNYTFEKGIFAHATSTIVYDLTDYSEYDYFTAYIGLNTTSTRGDGVIFDIFTSQDGIDWESKLVDGPVDKQPGQNATFLKVDIQNAKFLKLCVDDKAGNASDHSVYADAKLIKESYKDDNVVASIEEYDKRIKEYANQDLSDEEFELLVLQREFVNNVGQYALKRFSNESEVNQETLSWLINDLENLRLYMLGGTPDGGSYYNSLIQLSRLYNEYKDDFINQEILNNPWYPDMTKGDVYKKMAISLSLTHSTKVGYWAQIDHPSNRSDALERYKIYKYLYDNGKFVVSSRQDHTPWFEALQVEEMRYVMNNITDDEELIWLNEYTQKRIDSHPNEEEKYLQPHTYISYVWPNFENPIFHDPAKKDYWDEYFEGIFSKYGVTYSTENDHVYKAWMSMRNEFGTGAVCGGISKLGTHIRAAHGTPASVISQPGHAAIIYYRKNAQGQGYWTIDNDVSGWAQSGKTERLSIRMPLGWGNDSYVNGWAATYIVLAQEAINDYANYEKSEKLIMLANSYNNNPSKKEELLREALNVQKINIDAWWELIQLYKSDNTKTEEDYYNLASELGDALMPFPLPMDNLLNQIKPKFTSVEYSFKFTLLQTRLLTEGKNYTATDRVLQPAITRTVASFLLGQLDTTLASFSFDGENAGKIVLSNRFDENGIRWDYSLDGKQTWNEVSFSADEEHKLQLTPEQISNITSENDIYVHIVGVNYEEQNLYQIDIQESSGLPSTLYANDLENQLIATTPAVQWKLNETDNWTYYKESEPDLTGNKTLIVRMGATGVYLASTTTTYNFTANNDPNTRKYIPISHLSIHEYSTQSADSARPFYATNAIDGNVNTLWHTDFRYNVLQQEVKPFLTIKLDEPKYVSALEFIQTKYKANDPDFIKNGIVYVSMDGENWTEVGRIENCAQNNELKRIDFHESVYGQYVKFEMDTYNMFASVAMINLYEDTLKNETPEPVIPTAEIEYDITEKTTENVTARLVNPSTEITVTNNNGSTSYTFTENGEFTFEFVDKAGTKGTAKATVTWIEKELDVPVDPDKPVNPDNPDVPEGITSKIYKIEESSISRIAPQTTVSKFKENVKTEQDLVFLDKDRNELRENDILATGMTLKVGSTLQFTLIVTGDLDGNGKLSITDMAKLKLHYIEKQLLSENELKAADIDGNGKISITDLSQIKLLLIGKMEIK